MKRHILILLVLLSLPLWFAACGQAEEQAIDESLSVDIEERPQPGDMVLVPAGEFTMGSDKMPGSPPMAAPAHQLTLPDYEIDVFEVTNGQFARFQLESEYEAEGDWRSSYTIGREDYPVANVTWLDAQEYCKWAGKRLPTEPEWEKAARGSEGMRYPWGEVFDWTKSNTNEHGVRDVIEVGSLEADKSPYGCYDVMGNVTEWTADILEPYPDGRTEGIVAYNGRYVAVRGASYALKGESMTLWTRSGYMAGSQFGIGFRCARGGEEPEAEESAE
jgi:formylglycine-generating enzyme required for sulfatase activity